MNIADALMDGADHNYLAEVGIWICVFAMLILPFGLIRSFRNRKLSPLDKYLRVLAVIAIEAAFFAAILGLLFIVAF
ncbi:hypothetical protein GOEFS_016_00050 [Gordonia effusa NBRC 100432]|uniref:Uncharacterized protein n=1 Tax=Gordonia effusa NBRC 100432 TaxID=1077974 RepID=H0QVM8_9ACTN|nr:hypothetical protein [Gordonia effusa]GAB16879.1 hypothetical protein GOEFS_016_00050 [Gordonia effusa NBRC 100432]